MAPIKDNGVFGMISEGYRRVGAVSSFVLINGLIIAAITFVILFHETTEQKNIEVRNITRNIVTSTENSINNMEKTVQALGNFYASRNSKVGKIFKKDGKIDGVLWVTEKGGFFQENFTKKVSSTGWPGFRDLFRETYDLKFNQVAYWRTMPWLAFQTTDTDPAERPAGLVMKLKLNDGSTGIILIATTPAKVFGTNWATRRNDISRITIRDHETNALILDNAVAGQTPESLFFDHLNVNYVLQLGSTYWDVNFEIPQTSTTSFLTVAPWAAVGIIFFLTLIAAAAAERKHRQDQFLKEMANTLEGAHHEIQTKTSERNKLFQALKKSEQEYKAVINSVSDVIFETDENGRLTFLNETWARITDTDPSEYIGKLLFDALPPTEKQEQQSMFLDLVRGEKQAYRSETTLILEHGRTRAVEIAFSMMRMTEKKNIRVVGTITDIEKRRQAELAMRDAEQRYRTIFENAISGIYQTSPEGSFIKANPALAEILGYHSTDDLIISITNISEQIYIHTESREAFEKQLLFEGRITGIETEVRHKTGKNIWIMENARVVRDEKGKILYYEGSVWDITERKEAEAAMRSAHLQAEISSRSRMEFLANMSHELRTPLNAIIGFSEIIKDQIFGPVGTPEYQEYATSIYESGGNLLKIISEILELSKIETGNRELKEGAFPVYRALESCITIMASRIEKAGVKVKINLPDKLPELMGEELGFKQIMLNLISNAVKFSHTDGMVHVAAQVEKDGQMLITVKDTGIGMTELECKEALQAFVKGDNNFTTMKEGTGLGLTIVNSLVELHGGKFSLDSKKGKGTTARILLPASRVLKPQNVTPFKAKI